LHSSSARSDILVASRWIVQHILAPEKETGVIV